MVDPAPPPPAAPSPSSPGLLQIGQVAERTGLSVHTLRHYDEVGLVRPSARSEGGFRLYTDADVARAMTAKGMKPLGFSLEQMAGAVDLLTGTGPVDEQGQARREEYLELLRQRREKLTAQIAMADELTEALRRR